MRILLITGMVGLAACILLVKVLSKTGKRGFQINAGKVYFYSPVNGVPFVHDRHEMKNADAATFKVIKFPYAKDANHVFRNTSILKGCDVNSFEILSNDDYSKDKNHAYYITTLLSNDPKNFVLLGDRFAKDKNQVYWANKSIENADPLTFKNLGYGYAKDKHRVYYEKNNKLIVVEGANPQNFILDSEDRRKAIDGEKLFHDGELKSKSKDSFKKLDENYSMDNEQVFYNMTPLENADPNTFEILADFYSKDVKQAYFMSWALDNANSSTFQILKESYSHDGKNLYHRSRKLEGADVSTFRVLNSRWAKDKNHVYLQGYVNENLDAESFQLLKGGYVKDDNYVYHFETLVKNADAASFRTEGEYPKVKAFDKNHRYVGHSAVDSKGLVIN